MYHTFIIIVKANFSTLKFIIMFSIMENNNMITIRSKKNTKIMINVFFKCTDKDDQNNNIYRKLFHCHLSANK